MDTNKKALKDIKYNNRFPTFAHYVCSVLTTLTASRFQEFMDCAYRCVDQTPAGDALIEYHAHDVMQEEHLKINHSNKLFYQMLHEITDNNMPDSRARMLHCLAFCGTCGRGMPFGVFNRKDIQDINMYRSDPDGEDNPLVRPHMCRLCLRGQHIQGKKYYKTSCWTEICGSLETLPPLPTIPPNSSVSYGADMQKELAISTSTSASSSLNEFGTKHSASSPVIQQQADALEGLTVDSVPARSDAENAEIDANIQGVLNCCVGTILEGKCPHNAVGYACPQGNKCVMDSFCHDIHKSKKNPPPCKDVPFGSLCEKGVHIKLPCYLHMIGQVCQEQRKVRHSTNQLHLGDADFELRFALNRIAKYHEEGQFGVRGRQ